MSKHTPGPWKMDVVLPLCVIQDNEDGEGIATIEGDNRFSEVKGNARLIAAAPDLLEAAREAIEDISDGDFALASKRLYDAVAKAEERKDKDNTSGWFGLPEEEK